MALTLEKKILLEVIQLYKDLECLWNPSHKLYTNKLARDRAYDVLLEKYKLFDSLANKDRMKKRIENMRTTYRRERAKVIKTQLNDEDLYEPTLWYYENMKFLDDLNEFSNTESTNTTTTEDAEEERSQSPPMKRPKPASVYLTEDENEYIETMKKSQSKKAKRESVYVAEDDNAFPDNSSYLIKNEHSDLCSSGPAELFGRTVASQLNELQPRQRFIAEKLISEVIFYGRLEKLKTGSTLNLNDDYC